jgi:hypothetical protein
MNWTWLPGFLISAVTGIIAIAIAFTIVRERGIYLKEQKTILEDHLSAASKELQAAVQAIAVMQREQSVINMMTAKTLESLTTKVEAVEKKVNEQGSVLLLLSELLKRIEKVNAE